MLIRFTLFLFVLCFSFNYSFAQSKDLIEKVKGLIQTSKNSPKVSTGIQSIINAENEIIKRSKKTELHKMIRSGLEEQKKKSKQKEILLDSLKSKNNGLEVVLDSLKNVQDQFTQLKFTQNDLSLVLLQKSYKLQEELLHLIDARHPQNPVAETLKKTINPSSKYYQEQKYFFDTRFYLTYQRS